MLFRSYLVKSMVFSIVAFAGRMMAADQDANPPKEQRPADQVARQRTALLIGRWQPAKVEGLQEFKSDGTGVNIDGSKFLWRFEAGHLVARAAAAPEADEQRLTIRFTQDAKEYELSLQNGDIKATFYRVGQDGTRDPHATKAAAEYVDDVPRGVKLPPDKDEHFSGDLEVTVDVAAAPELRHWADDVVKGTPDWYPRLAEVYGYQQNQPVLKIRLRLSDAQVPGETRGRTITISKQWLSQHLDESSIVAHEMVHVLQGYGSGAPRWLVEGMAEYGRFFVIDPQGLPKLELQAIEQRGAYLASASMLDWLERTKGPGIIRGLHESLSNGFFGPATFEQIAGVTEDEAWRQFGAHHRQLQQGR